MDKLFQSFSSLLMPIALILIVYFLVLRPQQQKMKQHQELLNKIKRGDRVLTSGGFVGTVESVDKEYVQLALTESVVATIRKAQIVEVLLKNPADLAESKKKKVKKIEGESVLPK